MSLLYIINIIDYINSATDDVIGTCRSYHFVLLSQDSTGDATGGRLYSVGWLIVSVHKGSFYGYTGRYLSDSGHPNLVFSE